MPDAGHPRLSQIAREGIVISFLIPSSAHGTNPASAAMAGNGGLLWLRMRMATLMLTIWKSKQPNMEKANLAALMAHLCSWRKIEQAIEKICAIVHEDGASVILDGLT
ncbi:MAG: hypothetical protein H6667_24635 [Ardenticatenaceae bacterium]|nr:hypothetical protein [Ardenticatenaceae bacterium]